MVKSETKEDILSYDQVPKLNSNKEVEHKLLENGIFLQKYFDNLLEIN